jgi:hypothetical protein
MQNARKQFFGNIFLLNRVHFHHCGPRWKDSNQPSNVVLTDFMLIWCATVSCLWLKINNKLNLEYLNMHLNLYANENDALWPGRTIQSFSLLFWQITANQVDPQLTFQIDIVAGWNVLHLRMEKCRCVWFWCLFVYANFICANFQLADNFVMLTL